MDQTHLPFVFDDNATDDKKGAKEVWVATSQSGLDKLQCAAQLTIFGNGDVLPPLIIFRGQGIRINPVEKKSWDKRVKILFQPRSLVRRKHYEKWIEEDWNRGFLNPPTRESSGKILYADIHSPQQTLGVRIMLHKCKTSLINIPRSSTSRVQP